MSVKSVEVTQPPQRYAWGRRTTAVIAVVALCGLLYAVRSFQSSASLAASEHQLRSGFLEPLGRSGISTEVLDACHYDRRSPQEAWHLSVKIATGASQTAVIEALRARTRAVVVDDRENPLIQQFPGQPNRGWDGTISTSTTGTLISLVKNNVHTNEGAIGIGWLPVCPESRAPN
jgi:hypothetical protein